MSSCVNEKSIYNQDFTTAKSLFDNICRTEMKHNDWIQLANYQEAERLRTKTLKNLEDLGIESLHGEKDDDDENEVVDDKESDIDEILVLSSNSDLSNHVSKKSRRE